MKGKTKQYMKMGIFTILAVVIGINALFLSQNFEIAIGNGEQVDIGFFDLDLLNSNKFGNLVTGGSITDITGMSVVVNCQERETPTMEGTFVSSSETRRADAVKICYEDNDPHRTLYRFADGELVDGVVRIDRAIRSGSQPNVGNCYQIEDGLVDERVECNTISDIGNIPVADQGEEERQTTSSQPQGNYQIPSGQQQCKIVTEGEVIIMTDGSTGEVLSFSGMAIGEPPEPEPEAESEETIEDSENQATPAPRRGSISGGGNQPRITPGQAKILEEEPPEVTTIDPTEISCEHATQFTPLDYHSGDNYDYNSYRLPGEELGNMCVPTGTVCVPGAIYTQSQICFHPNNVQAVKQRCRALVDGVFCGNEQYKTQLRDCAFRAKTALNGYSQAFLSNEPHGFFEAPECLNGIYQGHGMSFCKGGVKAEVRCEVGPERVINCPEGQVIAKTGSTNPSCVQPARDAYFSIVCPRMTEQKYNSIRTTADAGSKELQQSQIRQMCCSSTRSPIHGTSVCTD